MSTVPKLRLSFLPFRPDAVIPTRVTPETQTIPTAIPPRRTEPTHSDPMLPVWNSLCVVRSTHSACVPVASAAPPPPVWGRAEVVMPTHYYADYVPAPSAPPQYYPEYAHVVPSAPPAPMWPVRQPTACATQPTPRQAMWDSVGIAIIDNSRHPESGTPHQTIFLGLNIRTSKYELFFGNRDHTDHCPAETVLRESCRASSNMFRFTPLVFDDTFSLESSDKKQRLFVVSVASPTYSIRNEVFTQNQHCLATSGAPAGWTEFSQITRISIDEARFSGILSTPPDSDFMMFDVQGMPITICSRDSEFIKQLIHSELNIYTPIHNLSLSSTQMKDHRHFLNKTVYYSDAVA